MHEPKRQNPLCSGEETRGRFWTAPRCVAGLGDGRPAEEAWRATWSRQHGICVRSAGNDDGNLGRKRQRSHARGNLGGSRSYGLQERRSLQILGCGWCMTQKRLVETNQQKNT